MTDLATIRDGWDSAARDDAFFNIITEPGRQNGGWTPHEFFAHGRREIDDLLTYLDHQNLRGPRRKKALDFGCGVGRLTQALAVEYEHVVGVDISREMINLARAHNQWGPRCSYVITGKHLTPWVEAGSCDLVYSRITLQHMPAELQRNYIAEFVKVLTRAGIAVFQIPDGPDYQHPQTWLSMYGVLRAVVEKWIPKVGGKLLDVQYLPDDSVWECYRYTMGRA